MTSLKKYRMALAIFLASSLPIIYLSLWVHEAFLFLLLANILFWGWRVKTVRCAQCGGTVAPPVGSSAPAIFTSLKTTACRKCGAHLD
jgi:hypothetical protein